MKTGLGNYAHFSARRVISEQTLTNSTEQRALIEYVISQLRAEITAAVTKSDLELIGPIRVGAEFWATGKAWWPEDGSTIVRGRE